MPELVCAVATSLRNGAPVEHVLTAAAELAQLPGIEPLEQHVAAGRPARFSTEELLRLERRTLELALSGRHVDAPNPDKKTLIQMLIQSREL